MTPEQVVLERQRTEEMLRHYGWTVQGEKPSALPQGRYQETWMDECCREVVQHLLNKSGLSPVAVAEECGIPLTDWLAGDADLTETQFNRLTEGFIRPFAVAEDEDSKQGKITGEVAGNIVARYKSQYGGK
jgi:hypothetical protein